MMCGDCGEIWITDFGIPFGSEPGFRRPALIIQNDVLNRSNISTTIVLPLTTNLSAGEYRGNVPVTKSETGLSKDSVILGQQVVAIDKARLIEKVGSINDYLLETVINELIFILGKE